MKISVIIPHHNGYDILNDCLKSLEKSDLNNGEIIIVNNDSTYDRIDRVKNKFKNLNIFKKTSSFFSENPYRDYKR